MKKGISEAVVQRVELMEGKSAKAALHELYTEQGMSYRQLGKRWKMQSQQLIKLMAYCGIEPRRGGEAIKMQWINNEERRTKAGKAMGVMARELAAQGNHSRQGKKIKDYPILQAVEAKRQAAAFKPSVYRKAATTRMKLYADNPLAHPNAKAEPTRCESLMIDYCKSIGYKTVFNYYSAPYWIDVYLPELNIGIECVNNKRPTWKRHASIAATGIHMLYIPNKFIESGDFQQLLAYLTAFPDLENRPSFNIKAAIIIGYKRVKFFSDAPENLALKATTFSGSALLSYSLSN